MPDLHTKPNAWQQAAVDVNVGLRKYMLRVYNLMAMGVGLTGLVAYLVASNPSVLVSVYQLKWVLFIALLGLGWFAPKLILTKSTTAAHLTFWTYATLWGLLIAPLIAVSLQADIARAFFITSGAFAGLSLYGYTTKRDLSPIGRFAAMATIGLLIAMLVNVFITQSVGFDMILSVVVVLVFSALTAYETQAIKNSYDPGDGAAVLDSKAIFGAFILYGAFITLFIWILHLLSLFRN